MSKNILRKKILVYRKNNYRVVGLKYSLLKDILKKFNLLKNKKIGAYFPINYEIDCLEILKQLEKSGHKISLPITKKGNKMDFFEWSLKEPLLIGKIGIPEPCSKNKYGIPEPEKLQIIHPDIILIPLVAFDKRLYRIGYGGGYYDRYIQKIKKIKKILTIGMAFSFQEVRKLPINEHDKKLDYIFTENYIK